MINFTDMTGLASSAVAITAMAVRLPGVVRLQRTYFGMLACVIVIVVLIPFGGLPLAACMRGWIGDLSIPSLVLLLLSILRPVCACPPGGELHTPSPGGVGNRGDRSKYASLAMIAIAALGLYPMALGIGYFDPYRLGYGNSWFICGLLLIALAACFRQLPVVALTIALAVLAWGVGWYESNNLWDYLLDPLLAIYAISALARAGIHTLWKLRRG
jgi:hypothetical protein